MEIFHFKFACALLERARHFSLQNILCSPVLKPSSELNRRSKSGFNPMGLFWVHVTGPYMTTGPFSAS